MYSLEHSIIIIFFLQWMHQFNFDFITNSIFSNSHRTKRLDEFGFVWIILNNFIFSIYFCDFFLLLIIFHFSFAYFTKAQVNNYIFMEHKKHRALSVLNLISFSLHLFKTLLTKTIIIGNLLDLLYFILCFWFFSQFKSVYECFILLLLFFFVARWNKNVSFIFVLCL